MLTTNRLRMLLAATTIFAGWTTSAQAAEPWDITLTPYFWAAGIDGKVEIGSQSAKFDYGFSDVWDNLDIGGSLLLEANRGRWVNWAEADYFDLTFKSSGGSIDGKLDMATTLIAVATGYQFDISKRSTIAVMVGMRYAGFDEKLKIQGVSGSANASDDVYDAVLVVRPKLKISENWSFSPTLSVGSGDSKLVYELSPQFEYVVSDRFDLRFGYRNLSYEFKNNDNNFNLTMAGLMIGAGIHF